MAKLERFEDIEAWKLARALTAKICLFARSGDFARDFGFRDQICRSAVSIVSNIAEGFERQSDKAFGQFLAVAKGSAGEVRAQLYVALDLGYIKQDAFQIHVIFVPFFPFFRPSTSRPSTRKKHG